MTDLIGLTGPIGVGKSTVANILKNYGYSEHAFADKLKQIVAIVFNLTNDLDKSINIVNSNKTNQIYKNYTTARLLQMVGQGLRDKVDNDIWIDSLFKSYKNDKWVISDIRYKNEYLALKQAGGILIKIEGNNRHSKDGRDMQHQSEIEMVDITADYIVTNFTTIEDLIKQIEVIIKINK